jgi:serine/threonine-protein kinase HipA
MGLAAGRHITGGCRSAGGGPRTITFTYGRSYLARDDAIALYEPELPLTSGRIRPPVGMVIASCTRDAGPDAWEQRVILARRSAHLDAESDPGGLGQLTWGWSWLAGWAWTCRPPG